MLSPLEVKELQREQYSHDMRNHFDILSLHKTDRLKHYGLHFAKYVGRLAREAEESKPVERTLVDAFLVTLSTANTLHQNLGDGGPSSSSPVTNQVDPLRSFADAAGRFADACEKIDHLEEFVPTAKTANMEIFLWISEQAEARALNLVEATRLRRTELAQRHFYIS